jgi:hypothetical protein
MKTEIKTALQNQLQILDEFVDDLEGWDADDKAINEGNVGWELELFHHNRNN